MEDFLAVEQIIIDRLKAEITDATVLAAKDLLSSMESSQLHPALHVLFDKFSIEESSGNGNTQLIKQTWLVVVVTKAASGGLSGTGARSIAGPLVTRVIKALSGWQPETDELEFLRHTQSGVRLKYAAGGFLYFPLAFTTSFVINSSN